MSKPKIAVISVIASAVTVTAIFLLCFEGHVRGNDIDAIGLIGFFLFLPAIIVSGLGTSNGVILVVAGFLQFLIVFWFILTRIFRRSKQMAVRARLKRSGVDWNH